MSNMTDFRLYDPSKIGTMILGCPRFGTHFLEMVVAEKVGRHHIAARGSEEMRVIMHKELFQDSHSKVRDKTAEQFISPLRSLDRQEGYHTVIINNSLAKVALLTCKDVLDLWHVIKLTHVTKIRWFLSWWFFLRHKNSVLHDPAGDCPLGHHGTSRESYDLALETTSMHTLTVHDLWQLQAELLAHHLNNAMPSDERIDYADLKNIDCLFNHWDENQYPDRPLDQMFTDAGIVLKMLEVWQDDTSRHMEAITC